MRGPGVRGQLWCESLVLETPFGLLNIHSSAKRGEMEQPKGRVGKGPKLLLILSLLHGYSTNKNFSGCGEVGMLRAYSLSIIYPGLFPDLVTNRETSRMDQLSKALTSTNPKLQMSPDSKR